jgi:hypothetical protein
MLSGGHRRSRKDPNIANKFPISRASLACGILLQEALRGREYDEGGYENLVNHALDQSFVRLSFLLLTYGKHVDGYLAASPIFVSCGCGV